MRERCSLEYRTVRAMAVRERSSWRCSSAYRKTLQTSALCLSCFLSTKGAHSKIALKRIFTTPLNIERSLSILLRFCAQSASSECSKGKFSKRKNLGGVLPLNTEIACSKYSFSPSKQKQLSPKKGEMRCTEKLSQKQASPARSTRFSPSMKTVSSPFSTKCNSMAL